MLTFYEITLLDEENVKPGCVDCIPCRNKNLSAVAFQAEINQWPLPHIAMFYGVLPCDRINERKRNENQLFVESHVLDVELAVL